MRRGCATEETLAQPAMIRFVLLIQEVMHHFDCCLVYRTLFVGCEPYFATKRPGIEHQQHLLAAHPFPACTGADEGLRRMPSNDGGTGSGNEVDFYLMFKLLLSLRPVLTCIR